MVEYTVFLLLFIHAAVIMLRSPANNIREDYEAKKYYHEGSIILPGKPSVQKYFL